MRDFNVEYLFQNIEWDLLSLLVNSIDGHINYSSENVIEILHAAAMLQVSIVYKFYHFILKC